MKRGIIFLLILTLFLGAYNIGTLRDTLFGFFGDVSYEKNSLLEAKKHYEDILENQTGSTLLRADTLYNLWNVFYRLGEEETDAKYKMRLWEEAVGYYTKSLAIRTDRETEENLAFVKEKLKKEREKKEEEKDSEENMKQEQEKNANTKSSPKPWEPGGNEPENTSGEENTDKENGQKPQQNWSNGGSYNSVGGQEAESEDMPVSEVDWQEVERYVEELKQFERQNGKFLNPEKPEGVGNVSDQIRDFFGSDPFFQDMLPSEDGKKDW